MDPAQALEEATSSFWTLFFQWLVPGALVLAALSLWLRSALAVFKGWLGEKLVGGQLGRVAADVRSDVLLPDGRGGWTQVDHLALLPSGIWVVETKNYSGQILGRARERTWTQKLGRQRFSFQNPLHQNYGHIKAVETSLPDTPVHGLVVFTNAARFPKGEPDGVVQMRDLAAHLREHAGTGEVPAGLWARWEALAHRLRTDPETRKAHLAAVGGLARQRLVRTITAVLLLLGIGLFLGTHIIR
ncbi:nuclease-related domain-containing protein [Thiohalorhabdus denitrificans]|uniref:Nuclease-related domain-containing protein n=1 Tax=Thiohalorhabdus denitrificans TaxID=381306 RepID=A0A1G5HR20_9GAMM|nr:nuclease-related domain-containing protein [Thiohalorhabdus denitrificans]SCY66322.1 Nuclease-related domain-containing protein [Thiohalorhabdus denitrificans]